MAGPALSNLPPVRQENYYSQPVANKVLQDLPIPSIRNLVFLEWPEEVYTEQIYIECLIRKVTFYNTTAEADRVNIAWEYIIPVPEPCERRVLNTIIRRDFAMQQSAYFREALSVPQDHTRWDIEAPLHAVQAVITWLQYPILVRPPRNYDIWGMDDVALLAHRLEMPLLKEDIDRNFQEFFLNYGIRILLSKSRMIRAWRRQDPEGKNMQRYILTTMLHVDHGVTLLHLNKLLSNLLSEDSKARVVEAAEEFVQELKPLTSVGYAWFRQECLMKGSKALGPEYTKGGF